MNEDIKYTIQKIFGSYFISITDDYISKTYYDVQDDIIRIIKQLEKQNTELKEKLLKLEDKYIHNVPCCNEEDCELYKNYQQLKDNWNKLKE